MSSQIKDPWFTSIADQLDDFCKLVDEKIDKRQQQLKACKKKSELETKLAQELKLNKELNERLAELSQRGNELDRVCSLFESRLTIADSDQNRLDTAKEMYQLAKELTGIRFDFSAPPNIVKGYIKCEHRKQLQPFELDMSSCPEALWTLLQTVVAPEYCQEENVPPNK